MKRIQLKYKTLILFSIVLIGFFSCDNIKKSQQPSIKRITLNDGWRFSSSNKSIEGSAIVPGNIYTDLLNNKLIEDPFFSDNEKKIQWVDTVSWTYSKTFSLKKEFLKSDNFNLIFEGLDTRADVFLNGTNILKSKNMFREYRVDIKDFLNEGENNLFIVFFPASEFANTQAEKSPVILPEHERPFIRKAQYMFGWDWGPRFLGCGIWRNVYIESWNDLRISNFQIYQDELSAEKVKAKAKFSIEGNPKNFSAQLLINGKVFSTEDFRKTHAINTYEIPFDIEYPKIWNPVGLGKPNLYDFKIIIKTQYSTDIDSIRFGFRNIELVQTPDSIGKSFYFRVNGKAVFMKGANYIPLDNFPARVNKKEYTDLIDNTLRANMNMIRVWGGGIYENDYFYELCDEKGLLIWQDFMFACAMYPGDDDFLQNVKAEIEDNVTRIRQHPSIALWCGNNEVDEAWHNWGWQKQFNYSYDDSSKVWEWYLSVFHKLIPEILDSLDPNRDYWPSSPSIGWGHDESLLSGDSHYWGVWWGEKEFEVYQERVGRFMSEYGFQGIPEINNIRTFIPDEELHLNSGSLDNHQKHPRGWELIEKYMERDFVIPESFNEYVYVSQLLQAEGVGIALDAHRTAMPGCMGTLYWQLNDCWPVVSWASLDDKQNWKALHYKTRKIFDDVYISPQFVENGVNVKLVNDLYQNLNSVLKIEIWNHFDERILNKKMQVLVKSNSVTEYFIQIPENLSLENLICRVQIEQDSNIYENFCFSEKPKYSNLQSVNFSPNILNHGDSILVLIQSDVFARSVYLYFDNCMGWFSDNFFHLLPGHEKQVVFYPNKTNCNKIGMLNICSLNDIKE